MIGVVFVLLATIVIAADPIMINGKYFAVVDPSSLVCNSQNKIEDRISCRMDVNVSDKLTYMPEDCMLMSGTESRDCLAVANAAVPCRQKKTDAEREDCFRKLIGMEGAEMTFNGCLKQEGSYRRICYQSLSANILSMAQFRLDELIDKATAAHKRGVSEYRAVGAIKRINTAKQSIQKAETQDDRVLALRNMQHDWGLFVQQAREELNATK